MDSWELSIVSFILLSLGLVSSAFHFFASKYIRITVPEHTKRRK